MHLSASKPILLAASHYRSISHNLCVAQDMKYFQLCDSYPIFYILYFYWECSRLLSEQWPFPLWGISSRYLTNTFCSTSRLIRFVVISCLWELSFALRLWISATGYWFRNSSPWRTPLSLLLSSFANGSSGASQVSFCNLTLQAFSFQIFRLPYRVLPCNISHPIYSRLTV